MGVERILHLTGTIRFAKLKIVCVSKYPKISDSLQLRNSKYILAKTWDRKDWQTQELTKLKI